MSFVEKITALTKLS